MENKSIMERVQTLVACSDNNHIRHCAWFDEKEVAISTIKKHVECSEEEEEEMLQLFLDEYEKYLKRINTIRPKSPTSDRKDKTPTLRERLDTIAFGSLEERANKLLACPDADELYTYVKGNAKIVAMEIADDYVKCRESEEDELLLLFLDKYEKSYKYLDRENRPKCPTCNSKNVCKTSELNRALDAIAYRGIVKQFRCKNCGYEW